MPWVKFVADFDWRPRVGVVLAYRTDSVVLVTTACARAAKAKGRAVPAVKPKETRDGDR